MKIGTYYYPEQWPRDQWERDFDHMLTMGLQIVHMGEFAWFSMEPAEGDIRLDWLAECVEMAKARKLSVILCTPTAIPPIWLEQNHPDILSRNADGTFARHGGRRHCAHTAPAYIEATRRIVTALADRFAADPAIIGWQIDNELSGQFAQNDHTHAAFRQWLRNKYETIDKLNDAWGCRFWNTYYTDWSQITFPASRDARYRNPHESLDASRFWSHSFAQFTRFQADIIRAASPAPFITTNYMPFHLDCNPADFRDSLNLFSWDSYPVSGWDRDVKDETYRMADPNAIGIIHDQMASYTGRWALMELQPGQINWSGVPVLLYPGAVRLWIWTAFAHGAEFVTTYRFRQPRFGIELFHHGLVAPDGITPSPGGREFQQTIDEMQRLDPSKIHALNSAPGGAGTGGAGAADSSAAPGNPPSATGSTPSAEVGLLLDFEQFWYFNTLPQARRWNQGEWLTRWYAALTRLGLRVRILQPDQPWPDNLPMIFAPGLQMVDEALIARLDAYASAGGHLVLTCRTALMDRTGQLFDGPTAAPILPLIGGSIEAYDVLPDHLLGHVQIDSQKEQQWGVWADLLYAEENTKVLAKYTDQFYAGGAAVIQNRYHAGLVTYCGVYAEAPFINTLTERLAAQSQIPIVPLPGRVHLLRRGAYQICLNYQETTFDAPAPARATFLVGSRKVPPAGVAVWEE
jgi:beta-galactosidase